MASRYQSQQQHQRYAPHPNQFHEVHTVSVESSEWNAYSDQSMNPSTATVSSIQSWASTDPSANQYSQSQQQPSHSSSHQSYVLPPRGSSAMPSTRNRSNSNNSTASGAGYGYANSNFTGSHLSHVSQASNSSAYSPQQQQPFRQYQDVASYLPSTTFNGSNTNAYARSDQYSQQGHSSYNTQLSNELSPSYGNGINVDTHTSNFQQQQHLSHQMQHRSTPSDASHISVNRAVHSQESFAAQTQPLMQSLEQNGQNQQGSPRMAHRSTPKRREQRQAATNISSDGELPSLDQYEEMLQKMASPTLGPSNAREVRSNPRRTELDRESRGARQTRKQQQQHHQPVSMDQMLHSSGLVPPPVVTIVQDHSSVEQPNQGSENHLRASNINERKLRRRSSLPTSLTDSPNRLLTDLRRRNSGHHSPMDTSSPASTLRVHPLDNPIRHHPDMGSNHDSRMISQGYENRRLLHVDEDDDNLSIISEDSERQRLDQQRRNKRSSSRLSQSSVKPPLTTKSQLRLSHTLSQNDVDEISMLTSPGAREGDFEVASVASMASAQKTGEDDRQTEQFQWEQHQQQHEVPAPRGLISPKPMHGIPPSRSRATTPLGIVAEEIPATSIGPNRQQLLASMDDGGPKRTASPISMKSRPTTPVTGIRPPPGPAPPITSVPISGNGAYPSPPSSNNGGPRKGTRDPARRAKPSPPVSTNIMPPTTPRNRAGSIAMVDGLLEQAPLSLPLPSLPPPPPPSATAAAGLRFSTASTSSDSSATQRRRKPSGGRDLIQPNGQLLAEYTLSQDSLPTPESSLPMTPEIGSIFEKEKELMDAKGEIQRLQTLLAEQDKDVAAAQVTRQELEAKLESMMAKKLHDEGDRVHRAYASSTSDAEKEDELEQMRKELIAQQESNAVLQQELNIFTERLQQEEAQYRTLQDTVQRLTVKISRLESQHAGEIEQIQRDHEEFLEKVVHDHANALTDLTEQSKADSEQLINRIRQEQQEQQGHTNAAELAKEQSAFHARERVLLNRLEAQDDRNQLLEMRIFELEKKQNEHDHEIDTWIKTNKSLERQLAIEQLQQEENRYQVAKMEQENQQLRAILADLDLAARIYGEADSDDENHDEKNRAHAKSIYERQVEKWTHQTQLLKHKMAKAEMEATAIMEKNMELMVALEMARSS
ncbi:hypothetical protein FBU30_000101 [Linnemannia zychae]|nr:hypothetical protein FBU30_000101 [Linnemannia zychae]